MIKNKHYFDVKQNETSPAVKSMTPSHHEDDDEADSIDSTEENDMNDDNQSDDEEHGPPTTSEKANLPTVSSSSRLKSVVVVEVYDEKDFFQHEYQHDESDAHLKEKYDYESLTAENLEKFFQPHVVYNQLGHDMSFICSVM
jgi:hypothetical protein